MWPPKTREPHLEQVGTTTIWADIILLWDLWDKMWPWAGEWTISYQTCDLLVCMEVARMVTELNLQDLFWGFSELKSLSTGWEFNACLLVLPHWLHNFWGCSTLFPLLSVSESVLPSYFWPEGGKNCPSSPPEAYCEYFAVAWVPFKIWLILFFTIEDCKGFKCPETSRASSW